MSILKIVSDLNTATESREPPTASTLATADSPLLVRLPILDAHGVLRGYHVAVSDSSFNGTETLVPRQDSTTRAIHVVVNVIGIDTIAGDSGALFVPVSGDDLARGHYLELPPSRSVLVRCAASGSEDDAPWIEAHRRGYAIATTHSWNEPARACPDHVAYVRCAISGRSDTELGALLASVRARGRRLVALGIDDAQARDLAHRLECDLLQGKYFLVPDCDGPPEIRGIHSMHVQLLAHVSSDELDRAAIGHTIGSDVSLAQGLLRRVNSAAMGVRQHISSIGQALSLLGDDNIRAWGSMTALSALTGARPSELVVTSLVRARFCANIADASGHASLRLHAHLVGLLSLLDAILAMPMERAIGPLGLAPDVSAALMGDRSQSLGLALRLAESCERGAWSTVAQSAQALGLQHRFVASGYYEALGWARRASR